jgi:hypothetical protein
MSTSAPINKSKDNMLSKFKNFFQIVIILIIHVLVYICIGTIVLYACKISQSNILPTDTNCSPYTTQFPTFYSPDDPDKQVDPGDILLNIFTAIDPVTKEKISQKISFPYDKTNTKNSILDILTKIKNNGFGITNYFVSILEEMIAFNYSNIQFILGLVNKILPESAILLLGPILLHMLSMVLMFASYFYGIYLWFAKMSWFFKTKSSSGEWENISWLFSPLSYFFGIVLSILFFVLFFVIASWGLVMFAIFSVLWSVFSIIGYNGQMNGEKASFLTVLKKVFKFHKSTITIFITFLTIICALKYIGVIGGVLCLLCALMFYFGIIKSTIYKNDVPTNLSALSSYDKVKKVCPKASSNSFFSFFSSGDIRQKIKETADKLRPSLKASGSAANASNAAINATANASNAAINATANATNATNAAINATATNVAANVANASNAAINASTNAANASNAAINATTNAANVANAVNATNTAPDNANSANSGNVGGKKIK